MGAKLRKALLRYAWRPPRAPGSRQLVANAVPYVKISAAAMLSLQEPSFPVSARNAALSWQLWGICLTAIPHQLGEDLV